MKEEQHSPNYGVLFYFIKNVQFSTFRFDILVHPE